MTRQTGQSNAKTLNHRTSSASTRDEKLDLIEKEREVHKVCGNKSMKIS